MLNRFQFLAVIALLASCSDRGPAPLPSTVERVVSFAPGVTEIVYALGLGDQLVGATTYCAYPAAAKNVARVGGYGQYNFEAIVSLRPDLVILHHTFDAEKTRLNGVGIPYLEVRTEYVADVLESIRAVGAACGAETAATELLAEIEAKLKAAERAAPAPRVLVTFGGDTTSLDTIHAFGADCLHNELLERASGVNVIENQLAFSTLSKEAVMRLDPDVIIQLSPGVPAPDDPLAAWSDLANVTAVKNGRVHVLDGDYACIPGPRLVHVLDDFKTILAPDE